jgi:hypothetical protein
MNIMNYVQQYAEQIGGQYTDYDHSKSVVVVPISGSRFQTVLAITQTSAVSGRDQALFSSKVCEFTNGLDLKNLLDIAGSDQRNDPGSCSISRPLRAQAHR